jgi:hypothetical protein
MQAITRAIEAQDRLVEEAKTGIVETALGTNECAPLFLLTAKRNAIIACKSTSHSVLYFGSARCTTQKGLLDHAT